MEKILFTKSAITPECHDIFASKKNFFQGVSRLDMYTFNNKVNTGPILVPTYLFSVFLQIYFWSVPTNSEHLQKRL